MHVCSVPCRLHHLRSSLFQLLQCQAPVYHAIRSRYGRKYKASYRLIVGLAWLCSVSLRYYSIRVLWRPKIWHLSLYITCFLEEMQDSGYTDARFHTFIIIPGGYHNTDAYSDVWRHASNHHTRDLQKNASAVGSYRKDSSLNKC